MSINFNIQEGTDHKNRPKLSEIERPEWANGIIFSPKAAKKAFTRYQLDLPWVISQAFQGTSYAWGSDFKTQNDL